MKDHREEPCDDDLSLLLLLRSVPGSSWPRNFLAMHFPSGPVFAAEAWLVTNFVWSLGCDSRRFEG